MHRKIEAFLQDLEYCDVCSEYHEATWRDVWNHLKHKIIDLRWIFKKGK